MNDIAFGKTSKSLLFLGHDEAGAELWLDKDQITRHIFIAGSTGSGKTELLLNIAANSLAWGSGALIVDGKGDINFFSKLHAIAHALNREDDLLLLNFSMSNVTDGVVSHTINPFSCMTADELCQIMAGMISSPGYHDGMWRERAVALLNVIIKILVWKRDTKHIPMTVSKMEELLEIDRLGSTYEEMKLDRQVDKAVLKELNVYLETLPGFEFGKKKQASTTREQHGYLTMQLTRPLNLLSSGYGHILNASMPDIDIADVVLNRRTLFIMLPSLEKSSSEISNIGRLMVGLIKSMMAQVLRAPVEGGWNNVVKQRMTNADTPYPIILDELGQYISDGMDTMAQQARSLNFGLIFSTQDFDSLQSNSPSLTQAILSNTNTKILMKTEYPNSFIMQQIHGVFGDEESKMIANFQLKRAANRTAIVDLLQYNHQTPLKREELAELLHKHNKEVSERMKEISSFSLPLMLKGFTPGDMLVIHGTHVTKGRAGYVELVEDDIEHEIKLEKFAHLTGYHPVNGYEDAEKFADHLLNKANAWLSECDPEQMNRYWLEQNGSNKSHLYLSNLLCIPQLESKPGAAKKNGPITLTTLAHAYKFDAIAAQFVEPASPSNAKEIDSMKRWFERPKRIAVPSDFRSLKGTINLLDSISFEKSCS